MLARIIEPAVGASTWALGSHRCREYRGSFTRKAKRHIAHHRAGEVGNTWCKRNIFVFRLEVFSDKIPRRRGRLAQMVYIIM